MPKKSKISIKKETNIGDTKQGDTTKINSAKIRAFGFETYSKIKLNDSQNICEC